MDIFILFFHLNLELKLFIDLRLISALAPTADVTILYQTVESEAFLYELVTAEKRQEMRGEKDDNMKRRSPVRREPAVHGGCVGGGVLLYW